jgi:hypothetical protein
MSVATVRDLYYFRPHLGEGRRGQRGQLLSGGEQPMLAQDRTGRGRPAMGAGDARMAGAVPAADSDMSPGDIDA